MTFASTGPRIWAKKSFPKLNNWKMDFASSGPKNMSKKKKFPNANKNGKWIKQNNRGEKKTYGMQLKENNSITIKIFMLRHEKYVVTLMT